MECLINQNGETKLYELYKQCEEGELNEEELDPIFKN